MILTDSTDRQPIFVNPLLVQHAKRGTIETSDGRKIDATAVHVGGSVLARAVAESVEQIESLWRESMHGVRQ